MTDETSFDNMKKETRPIILTCGFFILRSFPFCLIFYLHSYPFCMVFPSAWFSLLHGFPFCMVFPSTWLSRVCGFPKGIIWPRNPRQILGPRDFWGAGRKLWKKGGKKEKEKRKKTGSMRPFLSISTSIV